MKFTIAYRIPGREACLFTELENGKEQFFLADFNQNAPRTFSGVSQTISQLPESVFSLSPLPPTTPPNKTYYLTKCAALIDDLKPGEKAVLSEQFPFELPISLSDLFQDLCASYPHAFVYIFQWNDEVWVGATPEKLINQNSDQSFSTISLAGTKWDKNTLWTTKEIEEQQIVTDFILRCLEKNGAYGVEENPRKDVVSGSLIHLGSSITFQLKHSDLEALILDLHPTPAVSGHPRPKALKKIEELESHPRNWYAGIIGKKNDADTQLFVNLRCAKIYQNGLVAFAGGGVTSQSTPADEWTELLKKAQALVRVIKDAKSFN